MGGLAVVVDGAAPLTLYGDVEMSTVWPGGSDELSWSVASRPSAARAGVAVTGLYGGCPVWAGTLLEPDPSQDKLVAQGLWHLGEDYPALTSGGAATAVPNTAVDAAITAGLPWTRPWSVSSVAVDTDVTGGPLFVGALLDAWSQDSGQRWGVDVDGSLITKADETDPTYQVGPLEGGLGYSRDDYASTLVGRYATSTGYATRTVTDDAAVRDHGYKALPVDLTPRGVLTAAKADNILGNLLKLGRATPQFTAGITVTYGEVFGAGGTPVALEAVAAGHVVRVHGGTDMARGAVSYVDVLIGSTSLSGGELTIQPLHRTGTNLTDVLTKTIEEARGRR